MSKAGLYIGIITIIVSFFPPLSIIIGVLGSILITDTEQDRGRLALGLTLLGIICAVVTIITGKIYFTAIFDLFG